LDHAIQTATNRIRPEVLLFSGGVDSTLLAAMWRRAGHRVRAVTVGLDPAIRCSPAHRYLPYPCNSDLAWAEKAAKALDLDWTPVVLSEHDALEVLDWLLVQQRSFDLGQLNNIPLIAGLQAMHGTTFATGDDGDGLFGGYRFLQNEADWPAYIADRIPRIDPPARAIGHAATWTPLFPYLEPEVLSVVRELTAGDLWQDIPAKGHPLPPSFMDQFDPASMSAPERRWGKVILRRVAERWLPSELAWRPKTDLQFGSGMCALEGPLSLRLNPGILMNLESTGIQWFNDAHRGLYLRFRTLGLTIPEPKGGEYACRSCGGGVPLGKRHCTTCGCWPADGMVSESSS
ncbi:MAG TPA: asparagine synthase C-terminal domain-containing protein, partial [Thermomicrobiales bacterium]|nr:asparagine synthase C-terminal domain-containing protein [Thermomicrobiales bacterium]